MTKPSHLARIQLSTVGLEFVHGQGRNKRDQKGTVLFGKRIDYNQMTPSSNSLYVVHSNRKGRLFGAADVTNSADNEIDKPAGTQNQDHWV